MANRLNQADAASALVATEGCSFGIYHPHHGPSAASTDRASNESSGAARSTRCETERLARAILKGKTVCNGLWSNLS